MRDEAQFGFGSQFIMMTKSGATTMLESMKKTDELGGTRGHWDLDLKWFLGIKGPAARACYVVPGIGACVEHVSHCDTAHGPGWVRPSAWTERWVCPGTRRSQDPPRTGEVPRELREEGQVPTSRDAGRRACAGRAPMAQPLGVPGAHANMGRKPSGRRRLVRRSTGGAAADARRRWPIFLFLLGLGVETSVL